MSSRSIKVELRKRSEANAAETRCPACGKGQVQRVIVSRTYEVEGKRYRVDGLMPDKCDTCGELTWPDEELSRGREMLAIKLRKAAEIGRAHV